MWGQEAAQRLGAVVRDYRPQRGLPQDVLARQAGITPNQLQLIEAGRAAGTKEGAAPSNPRMSTLAGIAAVLEISVAELMAAAEL